MEQYLVKIQVTWGYLAVLRIVLVGGVAYFCYIVWQTEKVKLPTWKESLYPTLAYGLDEETQELLAGTLTTDIDCDFKFSPDRYHRAKSGTLILPEFYYILAGTLAATHYNAIDVLFNSDTHTLPTSLNAFPASILLEKN
jgi:hypothetical protein